jgi:hypothetical protein
MAGIAGVTVMSVAPAIMTAAPCRRPRRAIPMRCPSANHVPARTHDARLQHIIREESLSLAGDRATPARRAICGPPVRKPSPSAPAGAMTTLLLHAAVLARTFGMTHLPLAVGLARMAAMTDPPRAVGRPLPLLEPLAAPPPLPSTRVATLCRQTL